MIDLFNNLVIVCYKSNFNFKTRIKSKTLGILGSININDEKHKETYANMFHILEFYKKLGYRFGETDMSLFMEYHNAILVKDTFVETILDEMEITKPYNPNTKTHISYEKWCEIIKDKSHLVSAKKFNL
jgi:hypothetical protein